MCMLTLWVLVLASLFSRRLVDTGSHVLSGRTLAKNEVDSGRHSVCRVYLHVHTRDPSANCDCRRDVCTCAFVLLEVEPRGTDRWYM